MRFLIKTVFDNAGLTHALHIIPFVPIKRQNVCGSTAQSNENINQEIIACFKEKPSTLEIVKIMTIG